jgi:hypothetical protein
MYNTGSWTARYTFILADGIDSKGKKWFAEGSFNGRCSEYIIMQTVKPIDNTFEGTVWGVIPFPDNRV